MTITKEPIYDAWQNGDLEDVLAARYLMSDLREIESELAPLEAHKAQVREQLSHIVAKAGTISLDGLGRASITAPTLTKSYDTQKLNDLVLQLVDDGYAPIAQLIRACQKTTERAGSLRIEKAKEQ